MINFNKIEEIYKDRKRNLTLLIVSIFIWVVDVSNFILNIVQGNIGVVALFGVLVGIMTFMIIGFAITQTVINKSFKKEMKKIELEMLMESQKTLISTFEKIDKEWREKRMLAKEQAEKEKAETEKPKAKKKAESKAKAETKTTKKKN
jgi:hypothetical protein